MPIFKTQQDIINLNLTATCDFRTNNELLNLVSPKEPSVQPISMRSLENGDMYFDGSLVTRNGSVTLSNGIAGDTAVSVEILDIQRSGVSGTDDAYVSLPQKLTTTLDYPVSLFIADNNYSMVSGVFYVRGFGTSAPTQSTNCTIRAELFLVNQTAVPASGLSFMSGNGYLHNISYGGNYNVPIYPEYSDNQTPIPFGATPIAFSENLISLNNWAPASYSVPFVATWASENTPVNWTFGTPVDIVSGSVYAIRYSYSRGLAGQNIGLRYTIYPGDIEPRNALLQEFLYVGAPANQNYALRKHNEVDVLNTQTWVYQKIYGYQTPNFITKDVKTANKTMLLPIKGQGQDWYVTNALDQAYTAPVGQLFTPPSGETVYFGAYFVPDIFRLQNTSLNNGFYIYNDATASAVSIPSTGPYTVGVRSILRQVNLATGVISSGNYYTDNTSIVASGAGTISFDFTDVPAANPTTSPEPDGYDAYNNYLFPLPLPNGQYVGLKPVSKGRKTYILYDNPVLISSSGTSNYINSFEFYDTQTNDPLRLFQYYGTVPTIAYSAIGVSTREWTSTVGNILINSSGNAWTQLSGNVGIVPALTRTSLTAGMITQMSGNAITLLYDYRLATADNQKVVVGHSDKLYWTTFNNPAKSNWTVFHSGAAINNNALWSATTMSDLFFAHQYSQSKGQVWDSSTTGVSYEHGKRPLFSASGYTAAGSTLQSGLYNIILANSMESGGFRSSIVSGVVINSGQWIHVQFPASMQVQYPFDLNTNATHVFMTQLSGNIYYEAKVYDAASLTPAEYAQPLPNNLNAVFINAQPNTANALSVPEALNPPYPQTYLTTQIETPRFKKILPYFNYMIGIGASGYASTMYYSEILGPQIWGNAGDFHGTINVNTDDNDILTGAERFKQYLILFKNNSTYRVEFLEEGGLPFAIYPIDSTVGNLGIFSTVSTPQAVYGLSQYGPIMCNGESVRIIGQEIQPWYNTLDHNDLIYSYAVHDQANNTITWSIGNDDSNSSRNFGLVFNYKTNSWTIRRSQMWNCAAIVRDQNNFDQIWIGDVLGQVKRDNVGNVDSDITIADGQGNNTSTTVQMVAETPWLSLIDSSLAKNYRFISFNTEAAPGSTLMIEAYFDYATTPSYTRALNLTTAKSDNRINLGGAGKLLKLKFYNAGLPNKIKINKLSLEVQYKSSNEPSARWR